jgi:hypothetical protein
MTNQNNNPTDTPVMDEESFYRAGPGIDLLDAPTPPMTPILERLGPAPFKRPGFPVLGFLTTVYEHVAAHMKTYDSRSTGNSAS